MTNALEIWLKLCPQQDFPWVANTTAWPVDLSQDLKTLKRGTWTPRQAKGISTEELGASGLPELAYHRSTFFQVTGLRAVPRPHPILGPATSPRHHAPSRSLSGQAIWAGFSGVASGRGLGAALFRSPGTGHFSPGSELRGS